MTFKLVALHSWCHVFHLTSLNHKLALRRSFDRSNTSIHEKLQRWKWSCQTKPANLSNWILLAVKYDSAPCLWLFSHVGSDSPAECQRRLNVTLITLSLNGHERPWRTAKARVFEMSNLCLQRGGRWSLQQLFIIQSAESGGCLQLSTSVYCWRHSHGEERHKARCVWTAGSHSKRLFTLCTLCTRSLKQGCNKFSLSVQLCYFLEIIIYCVKCWKALKKSSEQCSRIKDDVLN